MTHVELNKLARKAYTNRYGGRMRGDELFHAAWMLGWKGGYRARLRVVSKRNAVGKTEVQK